MDKISWTLYSTIGSTSKVYFGTGQGKQIIKKEYRKTFLYGGGDENTAFDNEVSILTKLSGKVHFPRLLKVDRDAQIIYMTYCGKELYPGNMPKNYLIQLNEILDVLEQTGIDYRDFKLQHLRYAGGVISLIDFGVSSFSPKKYRRMITKKDIGHFTH